MAYCEPNVEFSLVIKRYEQDYSVSTGDIKSTRPKKEIVEKLVYKRLSAKDVIEKLLPYINNH
jgi:hypothetical protein